MQATPVYRTNDPFTFKINDFKLPSDLVDDIVNKRYPACLAVLITESLELEGLWVPSASPNIKDKVRVLPCPVVPVDVCYRIVCVNVYGSIHHQELGAGRPVGAVCFTQHQTQSERLHPFAPSDSLGLCCAS